METDIDKSNIGTEAIVSDLKIGEKFIDEGLVHTCTALVMQGEDQVQVGVETDTDRKYTETGRIYRRYIDGH